MGGNDKNGNVNEMLAIAYDSEDQDEIKRIAEKILSSDPNNVEALFLLADTVDETSKQLTLLERAYNISKKEFNAAGLNKDSEDVLDTDEGMVYAGILQRMIIPLADENRIDEAFEIAKELRAMDPEDQVDSSSLYYYILLKYKNFPKVLEETMQEPVHSLAWAWSRFIAIFMLSDDSAEKSFWEAISMSPDVPFYMFGKYDEPTYEEEEDFAFALLFSEHVMCNSDELVAWVMAQSTLFGLLSHRITDEEEYDTAIEIITSSDLFELYQELQHECEAIPGYKNGMIENEDEFDDAIIAILKKGISDVR